MAFASGICEADAGSAAKDYFAHALAKDQTEQLYE